MVYRVALALFTPVQQISFVSILFTSVQLCTFNFWEFVHV